MCQNELHARILRSLPVNWDKMPEWQQKQYTKVHWWKPSKNTYDIVLPCGYCLECRLNKAKQNAIKCCAEAKIHSKSCFVTLTYNDKNLPQTTNGLNTVRIDEIQKFFKKLLKYNPDCQIRRFYSCEYGYTGTRRHNGGNPHYHALIFGYRPDDLVYYKKGKNGDIVYKSKYLYDLWGKGFVTVGEVTIESAGYCARYTMKKAGIKPPAKKKLGLNPAFNPWYEAKSKRNRGINKWIYQKPVEYWEDGRVDDREPERTNTSRRPGIGIPYWELYKADIKKNEGFYVKTSKGVKLMDLPKSWQNRWKEEQNNEDYWQYWYRKQLRFEEWKKSELEQNPGFTWEELQKRRYEGLALRCKQLKRNEDFYTQEF